jgi:hypothetical protein
MRIITVTLVSGLLVGAYAGCGSGDSSSSGLPYGGQYNPSSGSSGSGGGGGGTGSSSGATGSSSGTTGSSSGSSGGSSSGTTADSGPPAEAGPPPMTLQTALTQFANCMSYSAFTDSSANGSAASDIAKSQTTRYGDCNACHNQGDGGFWASYGNIAGTDMTMTMFQETQQFPYISKWVTGTVDSNGNFKDLAPSDSIANQAALASQCTAGTPCHPKFQLDPTVAAAITAFVTNTITAWHAGTCAAGAPPGDAGGGG